MSIKLAIFDFDGTLADSFAWFMHNVDKVADRYNFRRMSSDEVEMLRGKHARQVMRHVGLPMWKSPLVARYMRRLMAAESSAIGLFPGVDSMLEALSRKGVKLAMLTSNSEENVRRILGAKNAALFSHYECNVSLFGKRARLRRLLRAEKLRPEQAICIGDELRDMTAADAEGIPFGAVAWGYTTAASLAAQSPKELFTSLDQIVEKVG